MNEEDLPESYHILRSDEIVEGYDSVGCLFYFNNPKNKKNQYFWYGSVVNNEFAKSISPEINSTTIQVAISILAALAWMIKNPDLGILEPEDLDTDFILDFCKPFLGDLYYKDVSDAYNPPGDTFYDLVMLPAKLFN
jgi:homospermidine synthase